MGQILDLAVIAVAAMVAGTLATLAWTLGVTIPSALRRNRRDIAAARLRLVVVERRLLKARAERTAPTEGDR